MSKDVKDNEVPVTEELEEEHFSQREQQAQCTSELVHLSDILLEVPSGWLDIDLRNSRNQQR